MPEPSVAHTHRIAEPGRGVDEGYDVFHEGQCAHPNDCPQTVLAQLLWEAYVGHVEKKDWKAWTERAKDILEKLERGT